MNTEWEPIMDSSYCSDVDINHYFNEAMFNDDINTSTAFFQDMNDSFDTPNGESWIPHLVEHSATSPTVNFEASAAVGEVAEQIAHRAASSSPKTGVPDVAMTPSDSDDGLADAIVTELAKSDAPYDAAAALNDDGSKAADNVIGNVPDIPEFAPAPIPDQLYEDPDTIRLERSLFEDHSSPLGSLFEDSTNEDSDSHPGQLDESPSPAATEKSSSVTPVEQAIVGTEDFDAVTESPSSKATVGSHQITSEIPSSINLDVEQATPPAALSMPSFNSQVADNVVSAQQEVGALFNNVQPEEQLLLNLHMSDNNAVQMCNATQPGLHGQGFLKRKFSVLTARLVQLYDGSEAYARGDWPRINLGRYVVPPKGSPSNPDDVTTYVDSPYGLSTNSEVNLPVVLSWIDQIRTDLPHPNYSRGVSLGGPNEIDINGRRLRKFQILPNRISTEVEGWRMLFWMTLDKRITFQDIIGRMVFPCNEKRREGPLAWGPEYVACALQKRIDDFRCKHGILVPLTGPFDFDSYRVTEMDILTIQNLSKEQLEYGTWWTIDLARGVMYPPEPAQDCGLPYTKEQHVLPVRVGMSPRIQKILQVQQHRMHAGSLAHQQCNSTQARQPAAAHSSMGPRHTSVTGPTPSSQSASHSLSANSASSAEVSSASQPFKGRNAMPSTTGRAPIESFAKFSKPVMSTASSRQIQAPMSRAAKATTTTPSMLGAAVGLRSSPSLSHIPSSYSPRRSLTPIPQPTCSSVYANAPPGLPTLQEMAASGSTLCWISPPKSQPRKTQQAPTQQAPKQQVSRPQASTQTSFTRQASTQRAPIQQTPNKQAPMQRHSMLETSMQGTPSNQDSSAPSHASLHQPFSLQDYPNVPAQMSGMTALSGRAQMTIPSFQQMPAISPAEQLPTPAKTPPSSSTTTKRKHSPTTGHELQNKRPRTIQPKAGWSQSNTTTPAGTNFMNSGGLVQSQASTQPASIPEPDGLSTGQRRQYMALKKYLTQHPQQ